MLEQDGGGEADVRGTNGDGSLGTAAEKRGRKSESSDRTSAAMPRCSFDRVSQLPEGRRKGPVDGVVIGADGTVTLLPGWKKVPVTISAGPGISTKKVMEV